MSLPVHILDHRCHGLRIIALIYWPRATAQSPAQLHVSQPTLPPRGRDDNVFEKQDAGGGA